MKKIKISIMAAMLLLLAVPSFSQSANKANQKNRQNQPTCMMQGGNQGAACRNRQAIVKKGQSQMNRHGMARVNGNGGAQQRMNNGKVQPPYGQRMHRGMGNSR
jgi:hypothetical protein